MKLTYIRNGETLAIDPALCNGCGACLEVCPHAVLALGGDRKAMVSDRAACMECGACARNCPSQAIRVKAGVGCAAAIIGGLLRGTDPTCGPSCGCSGGASAGPAKRKSACC